MDMEILLVQMAIARGKPGLNRAKVESLTANLKPSKPSLIVLPELFSTGYLDETWLPDREAPSDAGIPAGSGNPGGREAGGALARDDRAFLSALARRLGSWVAGSTVEAGPAGPDGNAGYRNLSLFFSPDGTERASYRKMHPFSFGGEDRFFSRGNEIVTAEGEGWIIQPSICYDLRFPELYRAGSRRGTHLILVQANWPQARQAHWETLLRARAIENQAYVAGVNCTGAQESLEFSGGSAVFSPKGEPLASGGDTECVVRAKADLDVCKQWRRHFPALRDRMDWNAFGP